MAIQKAIDFFKDAAVDQSLRDSVNHQESAEIMPYLEKNGYKFTLEEFEEAFNSMLVKCQTEEQADLLKELKLWFLLALD